MTTPGSKLKTRLIPCLLLKNGLIVRSEKFKYHQFIGDPITQLGRYNQWLADEVIYLDISRTEGYDARRQDTKIATQDKHTIEEIIRVISKTSFMPLTFGGRIRTIDDIRLRLQCGADKVTINTQALETPEFIAEAARTFGRQCIVVSIDVKEHEDGRYEVYAQWGTRPTGRDPVTWAKDAEKLGAGEIFLNSVDRDGTAVGYDLELIRTVSESTSIPVIACGGVGKFQDFVDGIRIGKASAAAAANIFHFTELSYKNAKKHMHAAGIEVRMPYPALDPGIIKSSIMAKGV